MRLSGFEPKIVSALEIGTYENPGNPSGTKCGTVDAGSMTLPPELVELVQQLASLSPDQQQAILQLAKKLSTGQKDPAGHNPPDRVEI